MEDDRKVVDLTVREFLEIWKNNNNTCNGKSCGMGNNMMEQVFKMMKK